MLIDAVLQAVGSFGSMGLGSTLCAPALVQRMPETHLLLLKMVSLTVRSSTPPAHGNPVRLALVTRAWMTKL